MILLPGLDVGQYGLSVYHKDINCPFYVLSSLFHNEHEPVALCHTERQSLHRALPNLSLRHKEHSTLRGRTSTLLHSTQGPLTMVNKWTIDYCSLSYTNYSRAQRREGRHSYSLSRFIAPSLRLLLSLSVTLS